MVSEQAIMATLPADVPLGIYTLRVLCGDADGASNALSINEPRILWSQGNCGNESTSGGTVRVLGTAISLSSDNKCQQTVRRRQRDAEVALRSGDFERVAALAKELAALPCAAGGATTRLRLTGPKNVTISATASSMTEYHAKFALPASLPPGEYTVGLSNGLGVADEDFASMSWFESPDHPVVESITVRAPAPVAANAQSFQADTVCHAVAEGVFDMSKYGPKSGFPAPGQPPVDSTPALLSAIAAADKAGGGTVYFPRGQYFMRGQIEVPSGVYLKGAGTDLVSLYWAETNRTNYPQTMIKGVPGQGRGDRVTWGLGDLTIYATAYYHNVIIDADVSCNTQKAPWGCTRLSEGFTMLRVRVRANAYFASGGPFSQDFRPRANVDFNFTQSQVQGVVMLTGDNWRVEGCDVLATGTVFWSGASQGGFGGNTYGILRGNKVRNGGNALAMDQWKQAIVEDNEITGATLAAMGNNVATYNGGWAQHVALLNNSISHVWGGDRELVTFDNAGGAWFGPLAAVNGTHVTASGDRIPLNRSDGASSTNGGGWVVEGGALIVLNGTGAGQVRRVVSSTGARDWTLDAPLDAVDLADASAGNGTPSYVQILPFRGRCIFHGNTFRDTGALQFYGIGFESIVSENNMERVGGLVSWGQWRGWNPTAEVSLRGEMGCGANPNIRNVFERNDFSEGNAVVNFYTPEGASWNFGRGYVIGSTSGGGAGGSTGSRVGDLSMNSFTVFRGNTIESNGGILIADDSSYVLVEDNVIAESDLQICVTNTTSAVLVRNNRAALRCSDGLAQAEVLP